MTYGDGNSYALQFDGVVAGSTGPGSLYYVSSTPGAIKNLIVVATGAGGGPVTTNFAGMDPALSTPSGVSGSNFFSGVWNSTLAAFTTFAGSNPLFFYNNNQVNSGAATNQNLAVWAQISLTGGTGPTLYFDFTNMNSPYALFTEGGGSVFMGNVGAYSSTGLGPIAGTNLATDYVLSGGAICKTAAGAPISCSNPLADGTGAINNNLGANQAAYAISAPELNAFLATWIAGGFPGYDAIHVDLRFGCDPLTTGGTAVAGAGDCIGRDANNGYEQLFIGTAASVTQTPEPGSLALVALGLISLGAIARRGRSTGRSLKS